MASTPGLYTLELRLERIPTGMWVPFGSGILNEVSASSCSRSQRRRPGRRITRTVFGLRAGVGRRVAKRVLGQIVAIGKLTILRAARWLAGHHIKAHIIRCLGFRV